MVIRLLRSVSRPPTGAVIGAALGTFCTAR